MSDYHRLSLADKQALQRDRMREPAVACPVCETQTTSVDLLEHMASRCQGPRPPGPGSRWISWREAMMLGAPRWMLSRWAQRGKVRFLGERQDRKYLMRDVAVRIAERRANRRR